ncbi:hypothetical protein U5A82_09240 [Sphingobium sp. CR2-8]|uniref:hypothetical protein n=1 Tax=Sphingobium sp. CR2-8 TaxID=1306534 RepID=UPI002DBE07F0|nr:hypothetical protein [Sphingobium sp. CR2-8]MEC3910657.1 hypothetical protein [Sphingobium sp. CR2-8]
MDIQRKAFGRSATGREGGSGPIVTVAVPEPYEGVGNALRATYAPGRDVIPDDMMALLAKLDRH